MDTLFPDLIERSIIPPPVSVSSKPISKKAKAGAPALQQSPSVSKQSTAEKITKINLKERYLNCIEELKSHYLMGPIQAVYTADPFLKAVDPMKYPGYLEVNELW
jgi:hypothetical protein